MGTSRYDDLLYQLVSGMVPLILSFLTALVAYGVWRLNRIIKKQEEAEKRGNRIIDIVSNGPANKLARRVLDAESLHNGIKADSMERQEEP